MEAWLQPWATQHNTAFPEEVYANKAFAVKNLGGTTEIEPSIFYQIIRLQLPDQLKIGLGLPSVPSATGQTQQS
jgi:hypothetical protein